MRQPLAGKLSSQALQSKGIRELLLGPLLPLAEPITLTVCSFLGLERGQAVNRHPLGFLIALYAAEMGFT